MIKASRDECINTEFLNIFGRGGAQAKHEPLHFHVSLNNCLSYFKLPQTATALLSSAHEAVLHLLRVLGGVTPSRAEQWLPLAPGGHDGVFVRLFLDKQLDDLKARHNKNLVSPLGGRCKTQKATVSWLTVTELSE